MKFPGRGKTPRRHTVNTSPTHPRRDVMKSSLLALVVLVVFMCGTVAAQTPGDFRTLSPVNGDWTNAANWQKYNGTTWLATATAPAGTEAMITIQTGDSININALRTITGILRNQGKLGSTSNLTIGSGGTYQHDEPNGSIPQSATWATGSTCLVTGF